MLMAAFGWPRWQAVTVRELTDAAGEGHIRQG